MNLCGTLLSSAAAVNNCPGDVRGVCHLSILLTSIVIPAVTAIIAAFLTFLVQERKLRRDYRLEFMAENAARELLESKAWEKRSFKAIDARLGGFEPDELRKVLVRAGAVRFKGKNGEELWGLLKRNEANPED
jgi:hypothetical protein